MSKTFIRFVIGGIISYGVKIAATFIATEVFHLWYFYSYLISLVLVIVVNYLVNVYYIFRVQDHLFMNFVKYLGSILLFYLADAALVKLLTDWLLLNYLVSIVISTTLFFFGKFVFYQFFLFKGKDKTKCPRNASPLALASTHRSAQAVSAPCPGSSVQYSSETLMRNAL